MATNQKCKTVLLPDKPTTDNAFKPHDDIAEALTTLIKEETTGRTIGLQGGWGAGKTTVSELLKKKLNDDAIAVVDFNAWAHEGDPLRRTFFETIVRALQDTDGGKGWVRAEDWRNELDELAQRRAVEERRAMPAFSTLGKWVIIAIFFVPFGGVLFGQALREDIRWLDSHQPIAWKFLFELLLGILFSVAPLLVGLMGSRRVARSDRQGQSGQNAVGGQQQAIAKSSGGSLVQASTPAHPSGTNADDLWSLLFVKTPNYSRTEVVKTPNPTSIEFEDKFNKLMSEVFGSKEDEAEEVKECRKKRKLVLVLDNLDRVAAKDALEIWATLQTFFQSAARFPSLWVIILYDLKGLRQLWDKDKDEDGEMALSFLDKTFAIRFEVPPPLVSDWHGYLLDNLGKAFPEHYANEPQRRQAEFHDVYRVYAAYLAQKGKLPTPRELKLFINQIGVLHRQREDDDKFPLALYAHFTLLLREKDAGQIRQGLLEGEIPPKGSENLYGPQAQSALAALLFNVDVETAQQLLLKGEIQKALTNNDVTSLKKLYKECAEAGFWEVLENVAAEFKESQPQVLAQMAAGLYESGVLTDTGQSTARVDAAPMRTTVLSELSRAAKMVNTWEPFNAEVAKGIVALFQLNSQSRFIEIILSNVAAGLVRTDYQDPPIIQVRAWVEAARHLYDHLAVQNQQQLFEKSVVATLLKPLQAPGRLPHLAASTLLEALCELEQFVSSMPPWSSQLVADSSLQQRLLLSPASDMDDRDFAWSMYVLLRGLPGELPHAVAENITSPPSFLNQLLTGAVEEPVLPDFQRVVTHLAEILIRFRNPEWLFNLLQAQPQSEPFVALCLDKLAEPIMGLVFYSPETVLQHFTVVHRLLPQSTVEKSKLERIVEWLVKEKNFVAKLCATTFDQELGSLYLYALDVAGTTNSDLTAWLEKGLLSLNKDNWLTRFSKSVADDLPNVLYKLDSRKIQDDLHAYKDALLEVARALLTSGEEVGTAVWQARLNNRSLLKPLGDGHLYDELRNELFDLALSAKGKIHLGFLQHFGNEITSPERLKDARIFEKLFLPLMQRGKPKVHEWLKAWLQTNNDDLQKHHASLWSAILPTARDKGILL